VEAGEGGNVKKKDEGDRGAARNHPEAEPGFKIVEKGIKTTLRGRISGLLQVILEGNGSRGSREEPGGKKRAVQRCCKAVLRRAAGRDGQDRSLPSGGISAGPTKVLQTHEKPLRAARERRGAAKRACDFVEVVRRGARQTIAGVGRGGQKRSSGSFLKKRNAAKESFARKSESGSEGCKKN